MTDHEVISFHRKLLNAAERMQRYQKAIHLIVKPGSVVLDLGCGSGILGLFACQAGAGRVYAVERSPAIDLARNLAKANGFSDRIVHINQKIKDVRLDEKVDVIVSELISKAVLGQKMSETVGWCRDNLLKPNGRIIPAEVTMYAAPLDSKIIYKKIKLPEKSQYGIDFSPVAHHSVNIPLSVHIPPETLLASGQSAYHYTAALAPLTDHVDARLEFEIARAGVLHGFALWFSCKLADDIILTNLPPGIAAWDNLFLPLREPIPVEKNMIVELYLKGRDDSQMPSLWAWHTTVRDGTVLLSEQKQSSFFARLSLP